MSATPKAEPDAESTQTVRLLAVRPERAAELLSLSRSRLYHEMRAGRIRSSKVGRARLVLVSSLMDFVLQNEEQV